MSEIAIGDRVFAVLDADDDDVRFFGFGTYAGVETPPDGDPRPGYRVPRINLDNGGVVYGSQCWWGPEVEFSSWVQSRRIVQVDAPEVNSHAVP